jgi:serine/threonine protein kinase
MGVVVAAHNEATGDHVAIKLLRAKAGADAVQAERFAREATAIARVKSEHVVRVLDFGTRSNGDPYIVMERLYGRDLGAILRAEGPLSVARAASYMIQVCEAVASAHAVGVVHRDLKPGNFFLCEGRNGETCVKVLDFGISKALGNEGLGDPNLTSTQAVFGSPTYMSPEQIRSAKHVDHRSDVWSLGVALYELVTGKQPFSADNVVGLLASIVTDPPVAPRAVAPHLPHELERLLLDCLRKDPSARIPSAAELGRRLTDIYNTETALAAEGRGRAPSVLSATSASGSEPRVAAPQGADATVLVAHSGSIEQASKIARPESVADRREAAEASWGESWGALAVTPSTKMGLAAESSARAQPTVDGSKRTLFLVAATFCLAGFVAVVVFYLRSTDDAKMQGFPGASSPPVEKVQPATMSPVPATSTIPSTSASASASASSSPLPNALSSDAGDSADVRPVKPSSSSKPGGVRVSPTVRRPDPTKDRL